MGLRGHEVEAVVEREDQHCLTREEREREDKIVGEGPSHHGGCFGLEVMVGVVIFLLGGGEHEGKVAIEVDASPVATAHVKNETI